MNNVSVGIVGASGYSGMELTRILASHPRVELRFVTSDRWVGESVGRRLGLFGAAGHLTYSAQEKAEAHCRATEIVFLATPAEVSAALAPKLLSAGAVVIDLSGAFRLKEPAAYVRHYGFSHPAPALLSQARYGLPELFREEIRGARLLANPGCYATAATLSLAPLLRSGLIEPGSIVINAASGVTGAGRKASEEFSFAEVDGDFRAYRVLRHQHAPEISQNLARKNGAPVELVFTPHLLPTRRGILCTSVARLRPGVDASFVGSAFADAYRSEAFMHLCASADEVGLKAVLGTNRCQLGFSADGSHVVVTSSIDNLVKGAAGQAVQNLNLIRGFEETCGLVELKGACP